MKYSHCYKVFLYTFLNFISLSFQVLHAEEIDGDYLDNAIEIGELVQGASFNVEFSLSEYSNDFGNDGPDIYYQFIIEETYFIEINTCNSTLPSASLYLLDENGDKIESSIYSEKCSNNSGGYILEEITPGTYYIVVDALSEQLVSTYQISLEVQVLNEGEVLGNAFEMGELADGEEYSDTQNTCSFISDDYGTDGIDIYYQFSVDASCDVILRTCNSSLEDTYLYLLDENGDLLESNYNSTYCSNTRASYIRRTLEAGTYYVVTEANGDDECGSITLDIVRLPSITPTFLGCEKSTLSFTNTSSYEVDIDLWECSADMGTTWREYSTGTDTLIVEDLSPAVDQEFLFRFSGDYNGDSIASNAGVLYINSEPDVSSDFDYTHTREITQTIYPDKDALVMDVAAVPAKASTNYGSITIFRAYYWTNNSQYARNQSFMEIDLSSIPQNAVIKDAQLILYGNNHDNSYSSAKENSYYLARVLGPWLEMSITHDNMPDVSSTDTLQMPETSTATEIDTIDLTDWVTNWHSGEWGNFGFMVEFQNLGEYRCLSFYSSDALKDTMHPKLVINYEVPARVFCTNESKDVNISGLDSYDWTPTTGLECTDCSEQTIKADQELQYFVSGSGSDGCTTSYSFVVFRCDEAYAELFQGVNNDYYKVKDGCLYFKFNEDYTVGSSETLDYNLYEITGEAKEEITLDARLVNRGANYYSFDLNFELTEGAYYLLEVINSKEEKQYLKFKF